MSRSQKKTSGQGSLPALTALFKLIQAHAASFFRSNAAPESAKPSSITVAPPSGTAVELADAENVHESGLVPDFGS